jgi:hypothetical protein
MKLKEAVELFRKEESAPINSYEWYRKQAHEGGTVSIGGTNVPAYKYKRSWHVDDEKFDEAIEKYREAIEHLKQVTVDYDKGIIHGENGDTISTTWGGYKIIGGFRFVWSYYEVYRRKSDGRWYCNKCDEPAKTEHDKEECHLCRDWNGCGRDCTLSRVYCPKCGRSIDI